MKEYRFQGQAPACLEQKGSETLLADAQARSQRQASSQRRHVFICDINEDGHADIVHVTAQGVEYWPGLGEGRYGQREVWLTQIAIMGEEPHALQPDYLDRIGELVCVN